MATAALFSETREPETEVFLFCLGVFFCFPLTLSIPIPSEPSVLVSGMMFCEGTVHTSMEK